MTNQQKNIIYHEIQKWSLGFRCFLLVLLAATSVFGVFATVREITDGSAQPAAVLLILICGVLIPLGIAYLIWIFRLETEVRQNGLRIRFFPFHRDFKVFELEDLSEYRVRRYRPLLEYGGWGIRWGLKGRAYNVSGNQGVQLVFKDGKRLLLGSARPNELEVAIRSIK